MKTDFVRYFGSTSLQFIIYNNPLCKFCILLLSVNIIIIIRVTEPGLRHCTTVHSWDTVHKNCTILLSYPLTIRGRMWYSRKTHNAAFFRFSSEMIEMINFLLFWEFVKVVIVVKNKKIIWKLSNLFNRINFKLLKSNVPS